MVKKTKNICGKNFDCCNPSAFYGLGFLGAVIYYISTASSFWAGVLGILKSLIWPAFLTFELFKYLGM